MAPVRLSGFHFATYLAWVLPAKNPSWWPRRRQSHLDRVAGRAGPCSSHLWCGETLLEEALVELLSVAWLVSRARVARLRDKRHIILHSSCGGDGIAEGTSQLLYLSDGVGGTAHAPGALPLTGISTNKRKGTGADMCVRLQEVSLI